MIQTMTLQTHKIQMTQTMTLQSHKIQSPLTVTATLVITSDIWQQWHSVGILL